MGIWDPELTVYQNPDHLSHVNFWEMNCVGCKPEIDQYWFQFTPHGSVPKIESVHVPVCEIVFPHGLHHADHLVNYGLDFEFIVTCHAQNFR